MMRAVSSTYLSKVDVPTRIARLILTLPTYIGTGPLMPQDTD
jgi:hypothetical protein